MPKHNVRLALFDIRPKGDGVVLEHEVNLRKQKAVSVAKASPGRVPENSLAPSLASQEMARPHLEFSVTPPSGAQNSEKSNTSFTEQLIGDTPIADPKDIVAREVEEALGDQEMLVADLVRAGITVHEPQRQDRQARPRVVESSKTEIEEPKIKEEPIVALQESHPELEAFWQNKPTATVARASFEPHYSNPFPVHATPAPTNHLSPAARNVEMLLDELKHKPSPKTKTKKKWILFSVAGAVVLIAGGVAVRSGAFGAKESVLQNGNAAVASLESAKKHLEDFKFSEAANDFALANKNFESASHTLSNFGASLLSVFGDIPGLRSVRTANNLVKAGHTISKAGENLSSAFSGLYKTNVFAMLDPTSDSGSASLAKPLGDFRQVLDQAGTDVASAKTLLEDVDASVLPDDKRAAFESFKSKIPDFQAYIDTAVQYSDFLLGVVGKDKPRTYMILFENTSERRPTGGFPGTYAIVSFEKGSLKKLFVDDIYNPDGQIKINVLPPIPLRHITPNFGIRDASWFADFPTSAHKVEEYYKLDGGAQLDGVFVVTPAVITKILQVIGPIEMPDYHLTLSADNFVAEVQDQVEYKGDRAQPKKIVTDFQPKFFAKLAQQDKDHWLQIGQVLLDSLNHKDMLAYFNDNDLQKAILDSGFAGEVKDLKADYLEVAFSNVKGAKADAVTANSMDLKTAITSDTLTHTLTIARAHHGGDSKYEFYNKDNPAYVKVYVPAGSVLDGIDGISKPNYQPLLANLDLGFKTDPDLAAIENTTTHPFDAVDVFDESGKTAIGFWMITKPKKTSTVTLKYHTPSAGTGLAAGEYALYWQKQSGVEGDQIHVTTELPDGVAIMKQSPDTQIIGTRLVYDSDLTVDREIRVMYH